MAFLLLLCCCCCRKTRVACVCLFFRRNSYLKCILAVDLHPLPPAWPLVESCCFRVVLLRSDGARPPGGADRRMRAPPRSGARLAICGWSRRAFKRDLDAVGGGGQERRCFTWSRAGFTIQPGSLGLARTGQEQMSRKGLASSRRSAHVLRPPVQDGPPRVVGRCRAGRRACPYTCLLYTSPSPRDS